MLTRNARKKLLEIFNVGSFKEFQRLLKQAKHPYPYKISWRSIALGKKLDGRECIHSIAIQEDPNVEIACVFENYIYIRFKGYDTIWRYLTSTEAKSNLQDFDLTGLSDLEEGDSFIAEPVTMARDTEYARNRREAIRDGTWKVKPRGPNTNMRRGHPHHYRPY